jgi:hypothetical protein
LKEWGVIVNAKPVHLEAIVLPSPTLALCDGSNAPARSDTLRKLPIQKVTHLGYKQWIMAYDAKYQF